VSIALSSGPHRSACTIGAPSPARTRSVTATTSKPAVDFRVTCTGTAPGRTLCAAATAAPLLHLHSEGSQWFDGLRSSPPFRPTAFLASVAGG
jgi:hypothetical protein